MGMKKIYFGLLRGTRVATEKPYLVWKNMDGGEGWAFDAHNDALDCLISKNGEWKKEGGEPKDSPFAIYCLMDSGGGKEWCSIQHFAD